jgi:hypothetical protein
MKLSTAIREGAKLRPQAFGVFFDFKSPDYIEPCASCAMGAAFEATTNYICSDLRLSHLEAFYPELKIEKVWDKSIGNLWGHITLLNDERRWTREQIADWLEQEGY